jgi:hypothetical protein
MRKAECGRWNAEGGTRIFAVLQIPVHNLPADLLQTEIKWKGGIKWV